jgi:hypothetical protein
VVVIALAVVLPMLPLRLLVGSVFVLSDVAEWLARHAFAACQLVVAGICAQARLAAQWIQDDDACAWVVGTYKKGR